MSQRPLATADSRIPTADIRLPAGHLLLEKGLKTPCDPHSINELKNKKFKEFEGKHLIHKSYFRFYSFFS